MAVIFCISSPVQNMKKAGNQESKRSAIRLVELGPRMHLELVKIEE